MKTFPTLYYKARSGAIHQWRVWADGDQVYTEYGQTDGKKQISIKRARITNAGKKNERKPEAQAEFDAGSLWRNKVERRYSETPEEATEELFLPMLAHDFNKRGKKVVYPAYVQPKLDGLRCMAFKENDVVRLMSRVGKPFTVPHIIEELSGIMQNGDILDGELFVKGVHLQRINSLVKDYREESLILEYHVYDVPSDENWLARNTALEEFSIKSGITEHIKTVDTFIVQNADEVRKAEKEFVEDGYEGAILRDPYGEYEWGRRSPQLLKVKSFEDKEFEVIGCAQGKGKFEGLAIWKCRNDINDLTFDTNLRGTHEEMAWYFQNHKKFIGKKMTVRFKGRTADGKPFIPCGVAFRIEEDLPN